MNNTPVNGCAGNFFDSGNSTGDYGNSQNFTKTFCSNNGTCLRFDFSYIYVTTDNFNVYDGPNTGSPLIANFSGSYDDVSIISTSGCLTFNFTSGSSTPDSGWDGSFICQPCPVFFTDGVTTNTCSATYYDTGGLNNYSNNENDIHTICPSTPGQYISINFNDFGLESGSDYLFVFDGNNGLSPLLGSYTGSTLPGTITASNSTGCLSFRFSSDGSTTGTGWDASIICTSTPAASPGNSPQDCGGGGGTTICSNSTFSANSSGSGGAELDSPWDGCLSGENQSSWYYFSPSSSGTIGLTISPTDPTDDYDFAIWGPYSSVDCPAFTGDLPFRCSYSSLSGNTGLGNGAVDLSEGVGGNKWVAPMNVTAGEVYIMVIDNYSNSGQPFNLTWNLTGGASLDCVPLSVEVLTYTGEEISQGHLLKWSTASEFNNSHYTLEHSSDGKNFTSIAQIAGAGNSTHQLDYEFLYRSPTPGKNYYRLNQFDFNGAKKSYGPLLIDAHRKGLEIATLQPNPSIDGFSYSLSFEGDEKEVQIELLSVTGKILSSESITTDIGVLLHFDWKNTAPGTYLFMATDKKSGLRAVKKVVRQNY